MLVIINYMANHMDTCLFRILMKVYRKHHCNTTIF